jgi:NAD(P)-dependent dehydrogenase (short-subunit alcohol dehydrogenase family)
MDMSGKVAVVTGGAGAHSIGRASGRLLAQQGCRVALADIDAEALRATVGELRAEGLDVTGLTADVADFASVQELADTVFQDFGRVDIALFNVGVGSAATLLDADLDSWNRAFAVNVYGVLHGIKAFVPRMIAQGTPGDVLGTSSPAGVCGINYQTPAYSLTKQAVCALMECLHGQLRDAGSLIRAHVVLPPLTKTNLAGDPEIMHFVQKHLESKGVPAVLADPHEVAVLVVEAIRSGAFWAHLDHEADQRLYGGKFGADIEWQDRIVRTRADALTARAAPDGYLWG